MIKTKVIINNESVIEKGKLYRISFISKDQKTIIFQIEGGYKRKVPLATIYKYNGKRYLGKRYLGKEIYYMSMEEFETIIKNEFGVKEFLSRELTSRLYGLYNFKFKKLFEDNNKKISIKYTTNISLKKLAMVGILGCRREKVKNKQSKYKIHYYLI